MTDWKMAMLLLLVALCAQRACGAWPVHKFRVWLAMMGASIAAYLITPAMGVVPLGSYIVIDTIAALIVLARPAGLAQKAVGFLFAIMVLYHTGVALRGASFAGDSYYQFQSFAGWAQFVILSVWGGADVGKSVVRRFGIGWNLFNRTPIAGPRG